PRPAYGYPQLNDIPPHQIHAQMLMIQAQNARRDGATAHVPPYNNSYPAQPPMMAMPQRYGVPPGLSKRQNAMLIAAGVTVFAGVVALVVVKTGKPRAKAAPATIQAKAAPPPIHVDPANQAALAE